MRNLLMPGLALLCGCAFAPVEIRDTEPDFTWTAPEPPELAARCIARDLETRPPYDIARVHAGEVAGTFEVYQYSTSLPFFSGPKLGGIYLVAAAGGGSKIEARSKFWSGVDTQPNAGRDNCR